MKAGAAGLSPVEYLLGIMRNEELALPLRLDAAKSVAPYTNPRLAVIDSTVKLAAEVTVTLSEAERRARARQLIAEAFAERTPRVVEGEYHVIAGRDVPADIAAGKANGEASDEREG
jgi:hypothetical protein